MRADALARKMQNNNLTDFWKEVTIINNSRTPLPEGVSCPQKIADLWREHYTKLFNCVKSNTVRIDNTYKGLRHDSWISRCL